MMFEEKHYDGGDKGRKEGRSRVQKDSDDKNRAAGNPEGVTHQPKQKRAK